MSFIRIPATTTPAVVPATIKFYWATQELLDSLKLRTSFRAKLLKDQTGEAQLDDFVIGSQEKPIFIEYMEDVIFELEAAVSKLTPGIDSSIFIDDTGVVLVVDNSSPLFYVNGHFVDITGTGPVLILTSGPNDEGEIFYVVDEWNGLEVGKYYYKITGSEDFTLTQPIVQQNAHPLASGFSIADNTLFNSKILPSLDKKLKNCIKYFIMREWYGSVGLKEDLISNDAMYRMNLIAMKNLVHELRKPLIK